MGIKTSKRWVAQTATWPPLNFDALAVAASLNRARSELGKLLGKAEAVGDADMSLTERDIWTQDALASSPPLRP